MSCLLKNTGEETSLSSPALRLRLGMGRVNQSDQVTLPRSEPQQSPLRWIVSLDPVNLHDSLLSHSVPFRVYDYP